MGCNDLPKNSMRKQCRQQLGGNKQIKAEIEEANSNPCGGFGNKSHALCGMRGMRGGGCHPPHATVELASGERRRIDQLPLGAHIRTAVGFEPVVGFLNADAAVRMSYYIFRTDHATLAVPSHHWIFADGVEVDPASVVVGQRVTSPHGPSPILSIGTQVHVGAYHLVTPSGTYFVDDALASTYVAYLPKFAWQLGTRYITLRYQLGLPIVAQGQQGTHLSHFWLREWLEALSVPRERQATFWWPAMVVTAMLTEMVNAAATATSAAVFTCAAPGCLAGTALTAGLVAAPLLAHPLSRAMFRL